VARFRRIPQPASGAVTVIQASGAALRAVVNRIAVRKEQLARRTLDRYREEVVGWQEADEADLASAHDFILENIDTLLSGVEGDEPMPEELLQHAREVAARRLHHGVSLEAMLHQGRLWGETVWEAVLAAARLDHAEEREAALQIAGRLWRHVDVLASTMSYAYLDELSDRGLLGRELLDALLTGQTEGDRPRRLARMLHQRLGDDHVVVVIRAAGVPVEDSGLAAYSNRVTVDRVVEAARRHLRPASAPLLIGIRVGDVVALYPAGGPDVIPTVREECQQLIDSLPFEVSIGMSGWHAGRSALPTAYAEAREAAEIAAGTGIHDRAVVLDDVLVDHMLRASPHGRRILTETLKPLLDYDRAHRSELVPTLRAYLAADANLTRSAGQLTVHPNTVVYRLRRIRELSGRDPHAMGDLQVLFLALKLRELNCGPTDGS
jgi:PucR C-terminal helix-turn-helix domain/GGDEF-like domain